MSFSSARAIGRAGHRRRALPRIHQGHRDSVASYGTTDVGAAPRSAKRSRRRRGSGWISLPTARNRFGKEIWPDGPRTRLRAVPSRARNCRRTGACRQHLPVGRARIAARHAVSRRRRSGRTHGRRPRGLPARTIPPRRDGDPRRSLGKTRRGHVPDGGANRRLVRELVHGLFGRAASASARKQKAAE